MQPQPPIAVCADGFEKDEPMARKIIIDTDPGQDDAVAILPGAGQPEL